MRYAKMKDGERDVWIDPAAVLAIKEDGSNFRCVLIVAGHPIPVNRIDGVGAPLERTIEFIESHREQTNRKKAQVKAN